MQVSLVNEVDVPPVTRHRTSAWDETFNALKTMPLGKSIVIRGIEKKEAAAFASLCGRRGVRVRMSTDGSAYFFTRKTSAEVEAGKPAPKPTPTVVASKATGKRK